MPYFGNPEVKAWMKKHEEEVVKIQAKYDELEELDLSELIEMAPKSVIAKVKRELIVGIIGVGGQS